MFKFGNLLSLPDLQSWFRWQNCSLPLPRTRIPNPEILRSKHEDAARVKRSAPCAVGQWALLQEVTIGTGLNVPWSDIHIIVPIRSWNLVNSPWVISNWFRHRPETKKTNRVHGEHCEESSQCWDTLGFPGWPLGLCLCPSFPHKRSSHVAGWFRLPYWWKSGAGQDTGYPLHCEWNDQIIKQCNDDFRE